MTAHADNQLSALELQTLARPPRSLWRDAWHRLLRNRAAVIGGLVILLFALTAILAPVIAPHNPLQINSGKDYLPPAWATTSPVGKPGEAAFPLGTDNLGRDVLSRVIYGARVSMVVGLVPVTVILILGITIGLFAGYRGGRVDNLLMRFADIIYAFPSLLFFIIVMTALRDTKIGQFLNGLLLLFLALSIVSWVGLARLVRGQVLSLKEKEFVEAARMIGAPNARIMLRHLLPNSLGPIIVSAAFAVPNMIITEATLGYLGIGLRPATDPKDIFITSWGALLLDGQVAINAQPWLLLVPAICVAAVVLAFNYVGDGLRDALDPRMAGTE
ncbi:MAG: ABC transporter permease [Chloroflexi bacterium]|nr:ABC transporter permease [Chloroflexota bacterium]